MLVLIWIVIVSLVAFSVMAAVEAIRQGGDARYAPLIPLTVLAAILLAKPRAVLTDPDGIRQHTWFGEDRFIAWNEVASIKRGKNTGTAYVKSRNGGRPISFSPFLVGQSDFERKVRKHVRELEADE